MKSKFIELNLNESSCKIEADEICCYTIDEQDGGTVTFNIGLKAGYFIGQIYPAADNHVFLEHLKLVDDCLHHD